MECLQYFIKQKNSSGQLKRFKPCYKWNAFNTLIMVVDITNRLKVLNLVINGMPSILGTVFITDAHADGFKPCYKWNAFNTNTANR